MYKIFINFRLKHKEKININLVNQILQIILMK